MKTGTIDLRTRCQRKKCNKIPRGKQQEADYARYKPFCSYHCQQWNGIEEAQTHLKTLKD